MISKDLSKSTVCKFARKNSHGITLIALVVTIVVLIILATITINLVIGEDGIIEKARSAKDVQKKAEAKDEESLQAATDYIDSYLGGWDLTKVDKVQSEDNIVVPVPKGYVASTVAGEKSVSTGFVIKEGENGGATEGINEFVWVPVSNISDIYDAANKAGQLWSFSGTTSTKITYSNIEIREPDVVTGASSGADSASGSSYDAVSSNLKEAGLSASATASDFQAQLQKEFNDMVKSVKTYGGFYIGRYETGNLSNSTKAVVQKNNSDISGQTWYTMYKMCKTIKANDNVYTGMIWGCQWDATLRWMQISKDSVVKNFPTNSAGKGNYTGTQGDTDEQIPTGSNSAYSVNNIYDMAGNVKDLTLEAFGTDARVARGGGYFYRDSQGPASDRTYCSADGSDSGCRTTLYIK